MSTTASSTTAALDSISIISVGDLAPDDHLWIVSCTIDEFYNFIKSPKDWVDKLGNLAGWTGDRPVLLDNFTMELSRLDQQNSSGRVMLQGISKTGMLTVMPDNAAIVLSLLLDQQFGTRALSHINEEWCDDRETLLKHASTIASDSRVLNLITAGYWEDVAKDPAHPGQYKPYLISVDDSNKYFFGHMSVYDARVDTGDRSIAVGNFVFARCLDPNGYIDMLNRLVPVVSNVRSGSLAAPSTAASYVIQGADTSGNGTAPKTFLYSGTSLSSDDACDVSHGPTLASNPPVLVVSSTTVKSYKE